MNRLTDKDRESVLIVDDSPYDRSRSKAVGLLSRGRAKILASALVALKGGQAARLVFVRDRRKYDYSTSRFRFVRKTKVSQ